MAVDIVSHATLPTGLIGYWSLDRNARDLVGTHNGALVGAPTLAAGKIRSCYPLNGTSQCINLGASNDFAPAGGISVFAWAYIDSTGGTWQWPICKYGGDAWAEISWGLAFNNSTNVLYVTVAAAGPAYWSVEKSSLSALKDSWHHVGFTYDNSILILYVDGIEVARTVGCSGAINPCATDTFIGYRYNATLLQHEWFKGSVDEPCIWDHALTPAEITDLYAGGFGLPYQRCMDVSHHPTLMTDLVGYWTLDTDANDSVGTHHGTPVNSPTNRVGKLRQGYYLQRSTNQYLSIPSSTDFDTAYFTLSFWFRSASTTQATNVVARRNYDASLEDWVFGHLADGDLRTYFSVYTIAGQTNFFGDPLSAGTWRHICVVATTIGGFGHIYLYENGTLKADGQYLNSIFQYAVPITVGRMSGTVTFNQFDGDVDELAFWDRALTAEEVNDLYQDGIGITYDSTFTGISDHPTLLSGLLCHYKLDDSCADDVNGLDGVLAGTVAYDPAGKIDNAAYWATQTGCFRLPLGSGVFDTDYVSVTFWANPTGQVDWMEAVTRWNVLAGDGNWLTHYTNDSPRKMRFIASRVGLAYVEAKDPNGISIGSWTHFSGTYDGAAAKLYRNGAEVASTPGAGVLRKIAPSLPIWIGCREAESAAPLPGNPLLAERWIGMLDEVLIHSRALHPSEVLNLFNINEGLPWLGAPPGTAPQVIAAATLLTTHTVRVDFNELMEHNADLEDPTNYVITGGTVTLTPTAAVPADVDGVTQVTLTFTGTSLFGETYTITVSAVVDADDGLVVDPAFDEATFAGTGIAPEVSPLATLLSTHQVRVDFTELMTHDAALTTPGNYVVSGGTVTLTPTLVTAEDVGGVTQATITFSGTSLFGELYTIEVSGVIDADDDLALNPAADQATFTGTGVAPTVVPIATLLTTHTVLVTYGELMNHNADLIDPTNYGFSGGTVTLTPTLVTAEDIGPNTLATITFTGVSLAGETYQIQISNVIDADDDLPLDPGFDTASFAGTGVAPQLNPVATALASNQVRAEFNELMEHDVALTTAGNYTFTGVPALTAQSVTAEDVGGVTQVTITFSPVTIEGSAYTVQAAGVVDANDGLPIDTGNDTADFTGLGVVPQVSATATLLATRKVRVSFNELMAHDAALSDPASYAFTGGTVTLIPQVVTPEDVGGVTRVEIDFFGTTLFGETYSIEVSGVVDANDALPLDPAHDTASFAGTGGVPPVDPAITVTAVTPAEIFENGGQKLTVTGTGFDVTHQYKIYIGNTGSIRDQECYSGIPGQGNIVYPLNATTIEAYAPLLAVAADQFLLVRDLTVPEVCVLADAITVCYQEFHSLVFQSRKMLPIFYKTGSRDIDQVPPI